jgi:hypothetical protein
MSELRFFMSISLGGFVAGPNQSAEDPLAVEGVRPLEWIFPSAAWREDKDCMNLEVKACSY